MKAMLRALCRRLRIELLHTRAAQLRCAAAQVRCTTPAEAVYQARLLAEASLTHCELAALESQR
jgi:hypothetical protein